MRSRGTTSFKLKLKVKVATELATNYYTIVHLTLASNPLFINLYRLGFSCHFQATINYERLNLRIVNLSIKEQKLSIAFMFFLTTWIP